MPYLEMESIIASMTSNRFRDTHCFLSGFNAKLRMCSVLCVVLMLVFHVHNVGQWSDALSRIGLLSDCNKRCKGTFSNEQTFRRITVLLQIRNETNHEFRA